MKGFEGRRRRLFSSSIHMKACKKSVKFPAFHPLLLTAANSLQYFKGNRPLPRTPTDVEEKNMPVPVPVPLETGFLSGWAESECVMRGGR